MDYESRVTNILNNILQIKKEMDTCNSSVELYKLGARIRHEVMDMRKLLLEYFQFERDNNLPINLKYREVYKSLKKYKTI